MLIASISLLLLLLFFIYLVYRRRWTKQNEHKLQKLQQQRRRSLENNPLIHEQFEYRLPSIHALPTIAEESPRILSPSNSYNKFTPLSPSINTIPATSPVVAG